MGTVKTAADRKQALKDVIRAVDREKKAREPNRITLAENKPVDIHVNAETLYNPLSVAEHRLLAGEIFDFIGESVGPLSILVPVRAVLHGVPGEEQKRTETLIKSHYESVLEQQLREKKTNTRRIICMALLGLIVLGSYLALTLTDNGSMAIEILSVISSFALWDAVDCFVIERRDIKTRSMETARLLSMEVVFEE